MAERIVCNACAVIERKSKADGDGDKTPPPGAKYVARNRAKD